MWIADAARCREMDRRAIEEFGVSSDSLMERAGAAVFEAIRCFLPHPGRVTFFCGKGNNGADAFVSARLAVEVGHDVQCLVTADAHELNATAQSKMALALTAGSKVTFWDDSEFEKALLFLNLSDVIVDGILGIGFEGDVKGRLASVVAKINEALSWIVSVDIPTGLNPVTGHEQGIAVVADHTVTFGLPKLGFFNARGLDHVGKLSVADIGYPASLLEHPGDMRLVQPEWLQPWVSKRWANAHKGSHGSVLLVAGSHEMRGAAILAAKGALRAGSGLVTVASGPAVCDAVASQLPEVMLLPLSGHLTTADASAVLEAQKKTSVAVFGPGLGCSDVARNFLDEIWREWTRPAVIDADALTLLSAGLTLPDGDSILTPHPGEMGRLLERDSKGIQADRYGSAREAAQRWNATVLLKGRHTLIADTKSVIAVNPTGNAGMATGGMGDVLSGVVAAFIAQGINPFLSSVAAAYLHGAAGDHCAATIGEIGFTASEVADAIPIVRAKLAAWPD